MSTSDLVSTRTEAVERLKQFEGVDLHTLASVHGITVASTQGKQNKGWAGAVIQSVLGMPPDNRQEPDFGDWELKVVPVTLKPNGQYVIKETMAITMIKPDNVLSTPFEESHLLIKLQRFLLVARLVGSDFTEPTVIFKAVSVDLSEMDPNILGTVKEDYEAVQQVLASDGLEGLSGKMGTYVQPRTKGPGHGSVSRAFYARKELLRILLGIE